MRNIKVGASLCGCSVWRSYVADSISWKWTIFFLFYYWIFRI